MIIHGHASGSVLELAALLRDCPVALRWGGNQVPGAVNGTVRLLDGLEQIQALLAAKVTCPRTYDVLGEALDFAAAHPGTILLSRQRDHSQGKDIVAEVPGQAYRSFRPGAKSLKVAASRFRQGDYWTVYTPSRREWRFHILRSGDQYTSIGRAVKVWAGPGLEPTAPPLVRSRRLGWHMDHATDPPKGLRSLAKAAVAACGYDLGAVDLLELPDGTGCVLEVNSRPALRDPYTLTAYARALRAWSPA